MWNDHYLKLADEAVFGGFREALQDLGAAIDEIGAIYRLDTGTASTGYHVNVRLPAGTVLPEGLAGHEIPVPALPKRVFMQP